MKTIKEYSVGYSKTTLDIPTDSTILGIIRIHSYARIFLEHDNENDEVMSIDLHAIKASETIPNNFIYIDSITATFGDLYHFYLDTKNHE